MCSVHHTLQSNSYLLSPSYATIQLLSAQSIIHYNPTAICSVHHTLQTNHYLLSPSYATIQPPSAQSIIRYVYILSTHQILHYFKFNFVYCWISRFYILPCQHTANTNYIVKSYTLHFTNNNHNINVTSMQAAISLQQLCSCCHGN